MFTFLKLKASTLFTLKNQIACNQNNFYKSCRTLKLPGVSRGLVVEVWNSNRTVIASTPVWSTFFLPSRLCHWLKKYFSWFVLLGSFGRSQSIIYISGNWTRISYRPYLTACWTIWAIFILCEFIIFISIIIFFNKIWS